MNGEWGMGNGESRARRGAAIHDRRARSPFRLSSSRGISLLEVLISMFVLLFGLLGVASMFPVGNFYASSGEQFDRVASAAPIAFAELKTRGIMRPEHWVFPDVPADASQNVISLMVAATGSGGGMFFNIPLPPPGSANAPHPGYAFVLDPLGTASAQGLSAADVADSGFFPHSIITAAAPDGQAIRRAARAEINPWWGASTGLSGRTWPVRRITLAQLNNAGQAIPMTASAAETIFRLRDDLADTLPEENDRPGQVLWKTNPSTGEPLARNYDGAYSWLATIVPTSADALAALQPGHPDYGNAFYDVSVAMFYRRVDLPSPDSERAIAAEMYPGGELAIYAAASFDGVEAVNNALEEVRAGQWIAVAGVHPTTGQFLLKWYRTLSIQDEISDPNDDQISLPGAGSVVARLLMLDGPDWPILEGNGTYASNLRAILLPGCVGVVTRPMKLETNSLWSQ